MNLRFAIGLVMVCATACTCTVHAQITLSHGYTIDDGLPSSVVHGMVQDRSGRMWFATSSGIVAYDGQEWEIVGSYPDLQARECAFLRMDGRGTVWVVQRDADDLLAYHDGSGWTPVPTPAELPRRGFRVTAFDVIDGPEGTIAALGTAWSGLWIWRQGSWSRVDRKDGLQDPSIRGIIGSAGRFLVATERSLANWSPDGLQPLAVELPRGSYELLAVALPTHTPDSGGGSDELWILSTHWLGRIRDGRFEKINEKVRFQLETFPNVLFPWRHESVYFGTWQMLFRMDLATGKTEPFGRSQGLLNEGATAILADREGNLWFSGYRGATKYASVQFVTLRQEHGLYQDEVSAICEPRPGLIVMGHPTGLTWWSDGGIDTARLPLERDSSWNPTRVLDLYAGDEGTLWVAAGRLGLGRYRKGSRPEWFGAEHGLQTEAASIVPGGVGELWIGGHSAVYRFDGRRFHEEVRISDPDTTIRRLFQDSAGRLYAGAEYGLYAISGGTATQLCDQGPVDDCNVYAFLDDSEGRKWVGTRGGLFLLADRSMKRPARPELQFRSSVFFIVEDPEGDLWFGTENGVVRWNGSDIVRYLPRHGLAGRETNRDAGMVDSAGRLWIGTEGGVSYFRSEPARDPIPPPVVELRTVDTAEGRLDPSTPIELHPRDNSLVFHYRGISFLDEKGVRYKYRLEGSDMRWSPAAGTASRQVRYTHLPPGRYRFHVRAANAEGAWSEPVSSEWIRVRAPIWGSWWVNSLIAAGTGLFLYFAGATYVRGRYAARLRREVEDRTAELSESEERYRRLFDDTAVPKILIDPANRAILDANGSVCDMIGSPRQEVIGADAETLEIGWIDELLRRYAEPGPSGPCHFVDSESETSRDRREIEVWCSPLRIRGQRCIMATVQDVTERRRLQDERLRATRLESVGLLAGGIAHDFNNLLATVLGNISFAREVASDGEDAGPFLGAAEDAIQRAKKLTGQLLAFSRGGSPIRRIVDVGRLCRESADLTLSGSRSNCEYRIADDLWPAEVDEGQFEQVVHNIVLNSVQAMPEGGTLQIGAENVDVVEGSSLPLQGGAYIRFSFEDTGSGIAPEVKDRIFDPYFTTKKRGSGLGLATAYAIVDRHDGMIHVESTEGRGTLVTVFLPASPGAVAPAVEPGEKESRAPGGEGRILVMDDVPALLELYENALQSLGYEVTSVSDGNDAVREYVRAQEGGRPFDLVVMDLTIPGGKGGRDTMRDLLRIDPSVRAVVASGYSNDPIMANHREHGFKGALRKPFTVKVMAELIREILTA